MKEYEALNRTMDYVNDITEGWSISKKQVFNSFLLATIVNSIFILSKKMEDDEE